MSQNKDSLVIEVPDTPNYEAFLAKEIKGLHDVKYLTVRSEENKNKKQWIVFGKLNGDFEIETKVNYEIFQKVSHLPEEIWKIDSLLGLDISFLGLDSLSKNIIRLKGLEELSISYNHLNIDNYIPLLCQLKQLKKLKFYGCDFNSNTIKLLVKAMPKVNLRYHRIHSIEDATTIID